MADVNRGNRPLSPHLQIYRPQWTSMSSIMVRITGIGCLIASVLVVAWLLAAASSEAAFAVVDGLLRSVLGNLILIAAVWGIFYHMLGRLRHVLWDFGHFIQVPVSEDMAKGMFILATLLTVFVVIAV
ncbi:succinate dehydrogenase, cytochrome b556 subunit [uncultured Tateyamaria sp.]|uniref:succinate dehydrogenase, cytochrome b556 subunit n=1 Tax=uncultured Tateyamaria sp. TaxID=455651 RepID=UPI002619AD3B|nr:succinate dehydrogenase, cytochrome b556 subunit [uncultured Tateyamaria sp.]